MQHLWYKKLKDTGFIDAETPDGHLKDYPALRLHRDYGEHLFNDKQDYFRVASEFYWQHSFQSQLERNIWKLHCIGFSLREIAFALRTKENKINKDNVQKIVHRFDLMIRSKGINDEG